jgi:FKBP-type peptidyl-prolyl cis-trans isomerase 2
VAARTPSLAFLAFVAVVVLIVAGVGGGVLFLVNHPKPIATPLTVARGDNVTVDYIGIFASGPEVGKVFDTSLKSVADNNATYPKSLEYSPRNASGYTPLPVHVGPKAPKKGYTVGSLSYGTVVLGFWQGLIGLAVNQSRVVTVPAGLGYGPLNTSCLVTAPLVQTIPTVLTVTAETFDKDYVGVKAATGVVFVDPVYKWTDRIAAANSSFVLIDREPTVGEGLNPYGWAMQVTNVTSRAITLTSGLSDASAGNVLGSIANTTVCSSTKFVVWSVDGPAGTFVENYNREVVGVTLEFVVTIKAIHPR